MLDGAAKEVVVDVGSASTYGGGAGVGWDLAAVVGSRGTAGSDRPTTSVERAATSSGLDWSMVSFAIKMSESESESELESELISMLPLKEGEDGGSSSHGTGT